MHTNKARLIKCRELDGLIAAYNRACDPSERILAIEHLSVWGMDEADLDERIADLRAQGLTPASTPTTLYSSLTN